MVGPNGCGKSSALQALYGCPHGYSLGNYWFSTQLDPIDESQGRRPYVIHAYRTEKGGEVCEAVKTRVRWNKEGGSSKNPDYWEPSRPLKLLGMDSKGPRHGPVSMNVLVMDFRYQLSAFDRYFYLEEIERWHAKKKRKSQDVLRMRAPKVKRALDDNSEPGKSTKAPQDLTANECKIISEILGKSYVGGRILFHRYYGFWANTIVFDSGDLSYSEANAGSGEVAVALLVHQLVNAEPSSLVLLDEPEYSLHPGAQRKLLEFLLRLSLEKNLQVVFTTHSPSMVDGLPSSAIKVFENTVSGEFSVQQNRLAEEAFVSIGHAPGIKAVIRVEDALAKELIEVVLEKFFPPEFTKLVDVCFYPGGVGPMKQDIVVYTQEDARESVQHFLIFDGDQSPSEEIDLGAITVENQKTDLEVAIDQVTRQDIKFHVDGGSDGGRGDQKTDAMRQYLQFWQSNVFFLPFDIPENEIWNPDLARKELAAVITSDRELGLEFDRIQKLDSKGRFVALTKTVYGRSKTENILTIQSKFVRNWITRESDSRRCLEETLQTIRLRLQK